LNNPTATIVHRQTDRPHDRHGTLLATRLAEK